MNIAERLAAQTLARPGQPAIIDAVRGQPRVTTFADLELASQRGARLLADCGLRAGDSVLVLHRMSAELYAALIAIFRLGLVATVLDPSAGRAHAAQCCGILPPRALVAGLNGHLLRLVMPALRRIPAHVVLDGWLPGARAWRRAGRLAPLDAIAPATLETPALVTFTSGSTGLPKAAVRTHGFLLAQHEVLEKSLALTPGEVDLATLPIFVLANLASGVTSVIPDADLRYPAAIDPDPVLAQIDAHRAWRTAASPALLARLAGACRRARRRLPLGAIFTGGAPVFPPLLDELGAAAPGARIVAVYGSTEAEPIAELDYADIAPADREAMRRGAGLLTGRPVPDVALRILRDRWGQPVGPYTPEELERQSVPAGEPGEIVVSGPHVLRGYLHGRGDEETKLRVGDVVWHRTGDAGLLDASGRLWLLGRCGARVEDAHGVLHPFAVECAAVHHEGIARAAVVRHEGARVLLVEPLPEGPRPDLAALFEALAWARLAAIRVYPRLPVDRRHNAKIDYPALARLLARRPSMEYDPCRQKPVVGSGI